VDLLASPIFNKRTAEAVVAAFALGNYRILSWNDLNQPLLAEAIAIGKLNFVAKVKSEPRF
jgi:hypothetical protein